MKRFISKSLSRSGESESEGSPNSQSAYEKRRAQVRKAQRKHRDRKATYLKALEIEVVNLRADNQLHKDEVSFLRRVLQDNKIVPPPWRGSTMTKTKKSEGAAAAVLAANDNAVIGAGDGRTNTTSNMNSNTNGNNGIDADADAGAGMRMDMDMAMDFNSNPFNSTSMLTVSKERGLGKPLQINFPKGSYTLETGQPIGMLDVNDTAMAMMVGVGMGASMGTDPNASRSATMSPALSSDVGGITAGMQDINYGTDAGTPYSVSSGGAPVQQQQQQQQQQIQTQPSAGDMAMILPDAIDTFIGVDWVLALEHPCMAHFEMILPPFGTHSHMASHQLMQSAPQTLQGQPTSQSSWQVPSTSIQSLLALSSSFQLSGELTPVQAWYRLKSDPRFGRLVQSQLDMLGRLLGSDVKCYGFGAVIDEDIWMLAVEEVLSQTR